MDSTMIGDLWKKFAEFCPDLVWWVWHILCDEFHLVRPCCSSQPDRVHRTKLAIIFGNIRLQHCKWRLWWLLIWSREDVSQSHVEPIHPVSWKITPTELIQLDAFDKNSYDETVKRNEIVPRKNGFQTWRIDYGRKIWKKGQTVAYHSVIEMNYTRWYDHSWRNSPQHQNSWRARQRLHGWMTCRGGKGDGRGEEGGQGGGQGAREVEESLSPGYVLSRTD